MKKLLIYFLIFVFSFLSCGCKNTNSIDVSSLSKDELTTTYLEVPDRKRPKSQEPMDNIFIALNILKQSSSYETISTGEVVAKKAITLATQNVNNRRIITQEGSFSESISSSKFVKVAEQLYTKEGVYFKRPSKKISSTGTTFKDTIEKLTEKEYLKEYGYLYTDPTRYIINKTTVISDIEVVNNGIGRKYIYKFDLDPFISTLNYVPSIKNLSGSSNDPKFEKVTLTITFDYKWRITKIESEEVYKINIPALGNVTCYSSFVEVFKNINKNIAFNEKQFFQSYL